MTTKDYRILGYTSIFFAAAFDYFDSPWISGGLCVISLVCLIKVIIADHFGDGGGDDIGPLKPA